MKCQRTPVFSINSDSEVWGIVLVVALMLDLWGFGAEKRTRAFGN
jgi:hypothetical protein